LIQPLPAPAIQLSSDMGAALAPAESVSTPSANPPPVLLNRPVGSIALDGASSYDPDGYIAGGSWSLVAAPAGALAADNSGVEATALLHSLSATVIRNSTSLSTVAAGLDVVGLWSFQLDVTDDQGSSRSGTVHVVVNTPPVAVPSRQYYMPVSLLQELSGAASAPRVAVAAGSEASAAYIAAAGRIPASAVVLDGSLSYDVDNDTVQMVWSADPARFPAWSANQPLLENQGGGIAVLSNADVAAFPLLLTATDRWNVTTSVPVLAGRMVTADAGKPQHILPGQPVVLSAAHTVSFFDLDGCKFAWSPGTQPEGVAVPGLQSPSSMITAAAGVEAFGVFSFDLLVTPPSGPPSRAQTTVTVHRQAVARVDGRKYARSSDPEIAALEARLGRPASDAELSRVAPRVLDLDAGSSSSPDVPCDSVLSSSLRACGISNVTWLVSFAGIHSSVSTKAPLDLQLVPLNSSRADGACTSEAAVVQADCSRRRVAVRGVLPAGTYTFTLLVQDAWSLPGALATYLVEIGSDGYPVPEPSTPLPPWAIALIAVAAATVVTAVAAIGIRRLYNARTAQGKYVGAKGPLRAGAAGYSRRVLVGDNPVHVRNLGLPAVDNSAAAAANKQRLLAMAAHQPGALNSKLAQAVRSNSGGTKRTASGRNLRTTSGGGLRTASGESLRTISGGSNPSSPDRPLRSTSGRNLDTVSGGTLRTASGEAVRSSAGVSLRTVSIGLVRATPADSPRTVTGGTLRTASIVAVRTAAGEAVRTASGGSLRTTSGSSLRTASIGASRASPGTSLRTISAGRRAGPLPAAASPLSLARRRLSRVADITGSTATRAAAAASVRSVTRIVAVEIHSAVDAAAGGRVPSARRLAWSGVSSSSLFSSSSSAVVSARPRAGGERRESHMAHFSNPLLARRPQRATDVSGTSAGSGGGTSGAGAQPTPPPAPGHATVTNPLRGRVVPRAPST